MIEKVKLTLEYIKVLVWPIIIVFLITLFWSPIKQSFEVLPDLIKNSESISIGSLSLKVQKNSKLTPSNEVKGVLNKISKEGVNTILTSDGFSEYFHSTEERYGREKYSELIKLNLYAEIPDDHLNEDPNGNRYSYGVMPTKLGIENHDYVLSIVHQLLFEIE